MPELRIVAQDSLAIAIRDEYPVSPGHTLIIPRRRVASFFETTEAERASAFTLLEQEKLKLDVEFSPQSYNIGINDGASAGQTILHAHIHLIPRYQGDQTDPRGGVRWVIPEKARYWR